MLTRAAEIASPSRLGTGFRWLMASSWLSNLGELALILTVWLTAANLLRTAEPAESRLTAA